MKKNSTCKLTKFFFNHCTTRAKIYPPYFIVQQTICQGSFGVLSKSIIFQMASMGSSVMTPSHHWQRQLTLETGLGGSKCKVLYPTIFLGWILMRPQNCLKINRVLCDEIKRVDFCSNRSVV